MKHQGYSVISYTKENTFNKINDVLYECFKHTIVEIKYTDGSIHSFHIKPRFRTDGGSVPKVFEWFVKGWSKTNTLLNLAYVIHDGIYGSECETKEVADEILHSMLVQSGLSSFRASMVCFAVTNFAKKHYGIENDYLDNDDYFVKEY